MAQYKRVLLKLSGESLMGDKQYGIDENRLDDYARQIKEVADMGVQVGIVIGGGNSGVEEAAYLATLGKKVVVIQDLPTLTADQKAQDILKSRPNVEFRFNSSVTKFLLDENGKMKGVEIKNKDGKTEDILGDGAFEYIGLIPVTDMVKDLGIANKFGYIEANDKMETKVPGIFSAGDVNVKQIRQVVTATADGAIAVQNALKYLDDLN